MIMCINSVNKIVEEYFKFCKFSSAQEQLTLEQLLVGHVAAQTASVRGWRHVLATDQSGCLVLMFFWVPALLMLQLLQSEGFLLVAANARCSSRPTGCDQSAPQQQIALERLPILSLPWITPACRRHSSHWRVNIWKKNQWQNWD